MDLITDWKEQTQTNIERIGQDLMPFEQKSKIDNYKLLSRWDEYEAGQNLTDSEKHISGLYQSGGFSAFNDIMRGLESKYFPPLVESHKKMIGLLVNIVGKRRLPTDLLLCRLITISGGVTEHQVGDVFSDRAFVSTSANPEFVKSGEYLITDLKPVVIQFIEAKSGTPALIMPKLGQQDEILLQANTKMEILESHKNGNITIQKVRVI